MTLIINVTGHQSTGKLRSVLLFVREKQHKVNACVFSEWNLKGAFLFQKTTAIIALCFNQL